MSIERISRLPSESEFEYHKRLIKEKVQDKALPDIDYSELSELIYDKRYSSDSARKMMYGSYRTLLLQESEQLESICDQDIINDIDRKMAELHKEQQKLYDQRREYRKLLSEDGRHEYLEERLIQAANKLDSTIGLLYDGCELHNGKLSCGEAVLVLCDWHYGMVTDNIWNTYDISVCKERVARVVSNAIDRIMFNQCSTLHVVVLGDIIHGAIHTSARVAQEELVCDQIMQASEVLAQSIAELSKYVEQTFVHMTYGNHARTVQNKNDSIHRDNMERLIPWWLKIRLEKYESIHVVEDFGNEFIFFDVCGYGVCASHGDIDQVKKSPKTLSTLFHRKHDKRVDYILLADKHHREEFEELGVSAMICGSLCGSDDYANDKRLYSTPEQLLLIFRPGIGADATYHIKCEY